LRKTVLILVAILVLGFAGAARAGEVQRVVLLEIGSSQAQVDGLAVPMQAPARIVEDRTLVPLRFIGEAFGCQVDWLEGPRAAVVSLGDHRIEVPIGKPNAVVNGTEHPLQVPAQVIEDRTYVPLRFVGESLGAAVNFDPGSYRITASLRLYRSEKGALQMVLPQGWTVAGETGGEVRLKVRDQGECIINLPANNPGIRPEGFAAYAGQWLQEYSGKIGQDPLLQQKTANTAGLIYKDSGLFQTAGVKLLKSGIYQVQAACPEDRISLSLARELELVLSTLAD